jgi:transposase
MQSKSINISELSKTILDKISRQSTSSVRDVERSQILLKLSEGLSSSEVEKKLSKSWLKVQRLRRRWLRYEPILAKIEAKGPVKEINYELSQKIKEVLKDEDRPGTPVTFNTHVYCQILGVSLEDPKLSDRPISEWSLTELKGEVEKRGIVKSISRSQLGAFLKSVRCKAA